MSRVGVYGGTFAPPHNGHVAAARAFLSELSLDVLYVIPTCVPPHKRLDEGDDPEVRLALARAAFEPIDHRVVVSDMEIRRTGVSYTADTLTELAAGGDELFFLCGTDMFLSMDTWYHPETIFRLATVVCMPRYEEADTLASVENKAENYRSAYGARTVILRGEILPLSSTDVRETAEHGGDVAGLVPPAVLTLIRERGLYGMKTITNEKLDALRAAVEPHLPRRMRHTLGVEDAAARLGAIYLPGKIPELRAAALLHDITKHKTFDEHLEICRDCGVTLPLDIAFYPKTLHAITAAALVPRLFPDFASEEIVGGVRWHTTGRAGMTMFEKIIYLADYIEDTRTFPDCVTLREFFWGAYREEMTAAEKELLLLRTLVRSFDMTVAGLLEDGACIADDTFRARNDLVKCLANAENKQSDEK